MARKQVRQMDPTFIGEALRLDSGDWIAGASRLQKEINKGTGRDEADHFTRVISPNFSVLKKNPEDDDILAVINRFGDVILLGPDLVPSIVAPPHEVEAARSAWDDSLL